VILDIEGVGFALGSYGDTINSDTPKDGGNSPPCYY